jgi:catechol 2,3-dioxygenase
MTRSPSSQAKAEVIRPTLHHINLKTTRLEEMIEWYATLVGTEILFKDSTGAWLSNDRANHRIALLAFPGLSDDPEKETRAGMHHSAFEYAGFEDLNASYLRLREEGITPEICIDHGMTLSYYYRDPDGNRVELQCDVFGDWARSSEWVRTSDEFHANPIGVFVDPDRIATAAAAGQPLAEIHRLGMAGKMAAETPTVGAPNED